MEWPKPSSAGCWTDATVGSHRGPVPGKLYRSERNSAIRPFTRFSSRSNCRAKPICLLGAQMNPGAALDLVARQSGEILGRVAHHALLLWETCHDQTIIPYGVL